MRQAVRAIAKTVEWISVAVLTWMGLPLGAAPNQFDGWQILGWLVPFSKRWAAVIVFIAAAFVSAARFASWMAREKSKEAKAIERLATEALDKFREKVFGDIPDNEPIDHNRVTLFKHQSCRFWFWPFRGRLTPWGFGRGPWSGWLAAVHRSGHLTKRGIAVFLAPDDASCAEGVAGQAFRRQAYRAGKGENKLPNLSSVQYLGKITAVLLALRSTIGWRNPEVIRYQEERQLVEEYAKQTNVSARLVWQRIKRRKICPISMVGIPVENSQGETWGVLVMDSRNEHECIDTDTKAFRAALTVLTGALRSYGVID